MNFRIKLKQFYNYLTHPKVVKFTAISATLVWISTIVLGILIGQLDPAGPSYDPAGFNILINYISDLGNLDLTPMPIILDFGMMQTSILMIPAAFYLQKVLKGDGSKLFRKILSYLTLICILIAMCGLFLTGVISEDVGEKLDTIIGPPLPDYAWHDIVADFAFIFFMVSGILTASQFILFPEILKDQIKLKRTIIARVLLAINTWVLTPIFFGFFYTVPYLWYTDAFWNDLPLWQWAPFWEWLLMFSLSSWILVVLNLMLLKPLNRELKSKKSD
ncbi:MAG: hypothetical protein ACFFA3_09825 [Promethearchaeota archaeon]